VQLAKRERRHQAKKKSEGVAGGKKKHCSESEGLVSSGKFQPLLKGGVRCLKEKGQGSKVGSVSGNAKREKSGRRKRGGRLAVKGVPARFFDHL